MSGIDLTSGQSAITTDAQGITHIVWYDADSSAIFTATYDSNSQTWENTQLVTQFATAQEVTHIQLLSSNTIINNGNSGSPGLVVVWQQGDAKSSNFYYTAAQYDQNDNLQWLNNPQLISTSATTNTSTTPTSAVSNLNPTAQEVTIPATQSAPATQAIALVGEKVNLQNQANIGVREGSNLYNQTFSVNSAQFNSNNLASSSTTSYTSSSDNNPQASYTPNPAASSSFINFPSSTSTVTPAATSSTSATPAASSSGSSTGYQGLGFSFNAALAFHGRLSLMQAVLGPTGPNFVSAMTKFLEVVGVLGYGQSLVSSNGTKSFNLTAYGSATFQPLPTKVSLYSRLSGKAAKTLFNPLGRSIEPGFRLSFQVGLRFVDELSFTNKYGLTSIKQAMVLLAQLSARLPWYEFGIPVPGGLGFKGSLGFGYSLKQTNYGNKISLSPSSLGINLGLDAAGALAASVGTKILANGLLPPVALGETTIGSAIASAVFASMLLPAEQAINGTYGQNTVEQWSLISPMEALTLSAVVGQKYLNLSLRGGEVGAVILSYPSNKISLTLPLALQAKFGPAIVGLSIKPTWIWDIKGSFNHVSGPPAPAIASPALATSSDTTTSAQVNSSLLTISFAAALGTNLVDPSQFTVTDTDIAGNTTNVAVVGVIVQGSNLILQLATPIAYSQNYDLTSTGNGGTPTQDTVTVSYTPSTNTSGNIQDASGNAIASFSDLGVAVDSPSSMSAMYNPAAGDGSNYASTGYQLVLNFSSPLNTGIVLNAADFIVSGNTVNAVQVQPYGIILSLANAPSSANPLVTYTPPSSSPLQDVLGNPIAGFSINSGITVSQTSSTTIFLSAFGATLNTSSTPSNGQFIVSVTDVDGNITSTLQVTGVLVKSNGVQLTVSGKIDSNSSDVNVGYNSNGSLLESTGKQVGSFKASSLVAGLSPTSITSQSVVSNIEAALGNASSPTMAPNSVQGNTLLAWVNDAPPITPIAAIVSQGANNSTASITLDFAGALTNTTNIPSASQFTISDQNGNIYSVNNLQVLNDSVQLTLNQSVASGAQLNISYKLSPNSNVQNLAFSDATNPTIYVDNFSNFSLTNTIGNSSAPILLGAGSIVTSGNTNLITLVFDQTVSGSPLLNQFTVLVNGTSYTVNEANAAEANNTVTLSVTPPTGANLIAPGDIVTVSYNSNGNPLSGTNGQVASFTNQPVITSATTPTTVLEAGFGTVGTGGYSFSGISSIPGTDGFNFTPAAAEDQLNNDVLVWSHATSQDIPTNLLPGQFYTSNQTSIINNSLSQASIQYSIYNPHTQQWTIATSIPDMPFGANSKPTLGKGPGGDLMAVWLNNNSQAIVNGDYQLELQTSGEYSGQLTLVNNTNNTVVWNSGNTSGATEALMQSDGNLVLYSAPQGNTPNSSQIVWQSNTSVAGAYLALDDSGNLEILSPTGVVLSQLYGTYNSALTTVNLSANQSVSNSTQIYESTLTYSGTTPSWSNPTLIYQDANPDPASQLSISAVNNQPAVFWTQTQAPSYQELVANDNPNVYFPLDDPKGSTYASNLGDTGPLGDATYNLNGGSIDFGITGPLQNPHPTSQSGQGDVAPGVTFNNGANAELDNVTYGGESFSVEFWFNAPSVESTNLASISGLLGINLVDNSNQLDLAWNLGSNSQTIAATNISTNAWHYVVATYSIDKQVANLYLDGKPVGAPVENLVLIPATTSNPVLINGSYQLTIEYNGQLSLDSYDSNGIATNLWTNGYIGANGQYNAVMFSNGSFEVLDVNNNVVWNSNTTGNFNYLALDENGNLAIVNQNGAVVSQLYGSAPDTSNSENLTSGQLVSSIVATTASCNITLAGTAGASVSMGQFALYDNKVLSYSNNSTNASAYSLTNLNAAQLEQIAGGGNNNDIGTKFAAQYNVPIPSGPASNYVTYNSSTNSWSTPPATINPIPTPIPTQLTNANAPTWDIVSNTSANAQGNINPNGTSDQYFQYLLTGEQGNIIDGISITSGSQTWGIGTLASGANQLGLVIGNKLLNSQDSNGASFSHTVLANQELLNLFIDNGSSTPDITNATITIDFSNANTQTVTVTNQQSINSTYEPNGTSNTSIIGTATVTEANDATLGNIDSGFNINTNNPAVGAAFAGGSIAGKTGQTDVAVVNRGYSDSNGNQTSTGSIQILFGNGQVLQGTETNPLTATDLSGNPDGVLIYGFDDLGISSGGLALSAALGYISSSTQEDLVIGDPNANNGQGVVYVVYGSYLAANPNTKINITTLTSSQGYTINPTTGSFGFGTTVAVGNFDGTGTNDIATGAPSTNDGAGAVYIAYNPTATNNAASSFYTGQTIVTTDSSTFVAGGYQLKIVGGLLTEVYNSSTTSSQTIWQSSNTTAITQALMNSDGQLVLSNANGTVLTYGSSGNLGASLCLDGYGNLAIVNSAGVVISSLYGAAPNSSTNLKLTANEFLQNDQNNYVYTNVGEAAGTALAVSHYSATNGINFTGGTGATDNLIVGAPNYSLLATNNYPNVSNLPASDQSLYPAQSYVQAGAVYVFNGATTPFLTYNGSNGPSATNGAAENSNAGSALAVGDWNGTGQQDLAIGAEGVASGTGAAYVLVGGKTKSTQNSTAQQLPSVSNVIINGYSGGGQAGSVLTSVPDLTGQSNLDDLVIGSPQAANATGQSTVVFGLQNKLTDVILGTQVSISPTANSSKSTLLLNGNQANQLSGSAALGITETSNNTTQYNLLVATTGAQQISNVFGHPWLADVGSLQLANLCSTNGFVTDGSLSLNQTGYYQLSLGTDGNLYLINNQSSTQTNLTNLTYSFGVPIVAIMQGDGNFVIYQGSTPLWASNTSGNPGAYLTLDDQGNIAILSSSGTLLHNIHGTYSSTNPYSQIAQGQSLFSNVVNPKHPDSLYVTVSSGNPYQLLLNSDGILNLINPSNSVVWSSSYSISGANIPGGGAYIAIMQTDGNFVVYQDQLGSQVAVWASNTGGNSGAYLQLDNAGNLEILSSSGTVLNQLHGTYSSSNTSIVTLKSIDPTSYAITTSTNSLSSTPVVINSFPFALTGNGTDVVMLGDITGSGFADVASGGSASGVIITFGASTQDLASPATTQNLLVTISGATIKQVVALGDVNSDGLQDFGILGSDNNFYVVFGNFALASAGTLVLNSNDTNPSTSGYQVISNITSSKVAGAVGDYNADGYADAILGNALYTGGKNGLSASSSVSFNSPFALTLGSNGHLSLNQFLPSSQSNTSIWSSSLNGNNVVNGGTYVAAMQTDGNFVVYENLTSGGSVAVWASNTYGNPGAYLALDEKGNLEILSNKGAVLNQLYGKYEHDIPSNNLLENQTITTTTAFNCPIYLAGAGDLNGNGTNEIITGYPIATTSDGSAFTISPYNGTPTNINAPDATLTNVTYTGSGTPPTNMFTSWSDYGSNSNVQGNVNSSLGSSAAMYAPPALAVFNGWLYMVYTGTSGQLYIQRTKDGYNWQPAQSLGSNFQAKYYEEGGPSLAVFDGSLYLSFTNYSNTDVEIAQFTRNDFASNGLGIDIGTPYQASGNTAYSNPTLVVYDDQLYDFFQAANSTSSILYITSSEPSNSSSWSSPSSATYSGGNQTTCSTIGATVIPGTTNNGAGTLLIAYEGGTTGKPSNNIYVSTFDGSSWSNTSNSNGQTAPTQSGPSLVTVGDAVYMFTQGNGNNTINIKATYDGQNWNAIQNVQNGGQTTSHAPSAVFFNQSMMVGFVPIQSNQSGTTYQGINFVTSNPFYDSNSLMLAGSKVIGVGDFNGDGIEDVAVLAPGITPDFGPGATGSSPNYTNSGEVFVYYGSTNGISTNASPDVVFALPNPTSSYHDLQINNISSAGDVNGDGIDDLLISASLAPVEQGTTDSVSNSGVPNTGVVYVVFGSSQWGTGVYTPTSTYDLSNLNKNQSTDGSSTSGFSIIGLPASQAGISLSGGADVNGDGLSDFVVGAPGNNDNLSYTIYGSDFNNTVNQTGTIGDDVMVGTPTGESFLGNQGNDQIYTNGGRDVVYAGPGDDLVTVSDTSFQRLDGGTGSNELKFQGYNGQAWNLTTLGIRIKNFEILDITNYGANTLTLNSLTVNDISPTGVVTVLMDSNDTLNLSSDFSYKGTVYDGNENLYQYSSSTTKAEVLVYQTSPNIQPTVTYNASSTNTPQSILASPTATVAAQAALSESNPSSTTTLDNNLPPQIYITSPTVSEKDGKVNFLLTRTGNTSDYLAARYFTIDQGAKAGLNYLAAAGQLVFEPGQVSKTITVELPQNQIYTGKQQFQVEAAITKESSTPISSWSVALTDTNGSLVRQWTHDPTPTVALPTDPVNPLSNTTGEFDFYVTADKNGQATLSFNVTGDPKANGIYVQNVNGKWVNFVNNGSTGVVISDNPDGTKTVKLNFQDGGRGDADASVNGVIKVNLAITNSPLKTVVGTPLKDTLTGSSQATQIIGLGGGDTLTGTAGLVNEFTYTSATETGSIITNFQTGKDVINLREVLDSLNYQGSDPIADHYVGFKHIASGTFVTLDNDGLGTKDIARNFIFVKGVSENQLHSLNNFVF